MKMTEKQFADLVKSQKIKVPVPPKTNKYKNVKVYVYSDGSVFEQKLPNKKSDMIFDSKKEYARFCELSLLEKSGEIFELSRQKTLKIIDDFEYDGEKIKGINYKADFFYINKDGTVCVEDVKPLDKKSGKYKFTKDFNLKWKLLKNKYPGYKFIIF